MLTAAQILAAKSFLQAAIQKNVTLNTTISNNYGDDTSKWPANVVHESTQRFQQNQWLQVLLDNVGKLAG